jgi:hypothetical protein
MYHISINIIIINHHGPHQHHNRRKLEVKLPTFGQMQQQL